MLSSIGTILSYTFVGALLVLMGGIVGTMIYYLTYDFWWRLRYKFDRRKTEHIRSLSIPLGSRVNEKTLETFTEEINRRIRARLAGDMHNIRTITMSTDKTGNCYITVWYKVKYRQFVVDNYSQSYNNPMSDWSL